MACKMGLLHDVLELLDSGAVPGPGDVRFAKRWLQGWMSDVRLGKGGC